MALIAHQTQVSFPSYSLRPKALTGRVKWRSSAAPQFIYKIDEVTPLKHHSRFRCQPTVLTKRKAFKVSSFKGNTQNDEPEGRDNGSKYSKSSVQLSAQDREETILESYDATDPASYASEEKEQYKAKSLAIKQLFKKWLVMLRTQTSNQTLNESCTEKTTQNISAESQQAPKAMKEGNMLQTSLVYFLRLDAAISIPLSLLIPGYLAVRLTYGAEVTKELTPLWFLGPIIVAVYVKIIQALCSLYFFLFMQAVRLVMNLPTYSLLAYQYIAEGRLKAYLWVRFWKPVIDIMKLDYGAAFMQKYKQLEAWAVEKYLDYVESIWPYYCRTIRFLKKANLL